MLPYSHPHSHTRSGSTPAITAGGLGGVRNHHHHAQLPPNSHSHSHAHTHTHSYSTPPHQGSSIPHDAPSYAHKPGPDRTYRSHDSDQDHDTATRWPSHRTYEPACPPPSKQASYPPVITPPAQPERTALPDTWAIPPSGPNTSWIDTMAPPSLTPHTTLPAFPTPSDAPKPVDKDPSRTPIISRLKNKLTGGRFPLSRTWEKASFAEECQSAPASMVSMPIAEAGERGVGKVAVSGVERDGQGTSGERKRDKKTVVNRGAAAVGEGAFSPSGRPTSLYASPAALRAFRPLPPTASLPLSPSSGASAGLTSA